MKLYSHYYADGAFVPSAGPQAVAVVNPASEEAVAEVRICSRSELDHAVQCAHRALDTWSGSTLDERKQALQRLAKAIEARTDAFAEVLAREMGCPVWLGKLMQIPMPLKNLEFTIAGIDEIQWSEVIGNAVVERVPVGVIAAITPWNFPVHQIVAKVAAAIAAGCTVVLKPSEVAPGAAWLFMEAVHDAGLPPGTVNLVWGGAELGAALVEHPLVDQVSFTGSTPVGRRIMEGAAAGLKRVMLELGGKSAAVLLPDADLDAALPVVARLSMANSGQACVSQSRLIAPRQLVPRIEEKLAGLLRAWPLGDPMDEATRLGPVATASQFRHISGMVERAREQGAALRFGGAQRASGFSRGWYCAPTLFSAVTPEMDLAQQEVFGPVLAIMPYDDEEEALKLANSTRYGLSGAVWSQDLDHACRFARGMRTGQVVLNGAAQNLATPFGGFRHSGFGRENGRFGIEDCLSYRSLHGASSAR
jgi:aldehyde dehydrogenase (NAD+)